MAHGNMGSAQRRSDAIALARVLCIGGVVYVHAWTGLGGENLEAMRGTWQENLRWVLMEVFGRSAVPLLGIISGYLVDGSRRIDDWRAHVARKARTILLPMVAWNAIALVLVCGAALTIGLAAPIPRSLGWTLQELLILTHPPDINVQMPFLRDLFLCMVLAPLISRLPVRGLLGVVAIAAAGHVFAFGEPVFLRISILMFFALGMIARRVSLPERIGATAMPVLFAPFAILIAVRIGLDFRPPVEGAERAFAAFDLALRVAAAAFFWKLAWTLAVWPGRSRILRIEPYAFFYFAAHLIVIWLGGPLLGKLTGKLGAPLYPLGLLLQPVLVALIVIPAAALLDRHAPAIASLLSGGRLDRRRTTERARLAVPAAPERGATGRTTLHPAPRPTPEPSGPGA